MSTFIRALLVVAGIACLAGGFLASGLSRYSQEYARHAMRLAREPQGLANPQAQEKAINIELESSNFFGGLIAKAAIAFGTIAGGALIFAAHLLGKSEQMRLCLSDAIAKLEAEIANHYENNIRSPQYAAMIVRREARNRFLLNENQFNQALVEHLKFAPAEVIGFIDDLEADHGYDISAHVTVASASISDIINATVGGLAQEASNSPGSGRYVQL